MKSTVFLRSSRGIHLGETKPPTGFCKNRLSGYPEEQKTAKTAFRGTPKSEKQRKQRFGAPRRAKNGKNCKFRGQNRQKTAKTANSVDRIVRNRQKLQILRAESSEIGENCVSQLWEKQNRPKTAFPNFGKSKITQKQPFPTLIRLFFLIFAYKIKDMIWK